MEHGLLIMEAELLRKALKILGWDAEKLRAALNAQRTHDGPAISRSSLHRWLSGDTPPNLPLKAFLAEKILQTLDDHLPPPRPLTTVIVVSPGGAGRTPMAYEMAACAHRIGIRTGVVEHTNDDKMSFWWGVAGTTILGSIIRPERLNENPAESGKELVFVDAPSLSDLLHRTPERALVLSPMGRSILQGSPAVLLIGQLGDLRNERVFEFGRIAARMGLTVTAMLGLSPLTTLLGAKEAQALEDDGIELFIYQKPSDRSASDVFRECLADAQFSGTEQLAYSVSLATYELTLRLGWPDHIRSRASGAPRSLSEVVEFCGPVSLAD